MTIMFDPMCLVLPVSVLVVGILLMVLAQRLLSEYSWKRFLVFVGISALSLIVLLASPLGWERRVLLREKPTPEPTYVNNNLREVSEYMKSSNRLYRECTDSLRDCVDNARSTVNTLDKCIGMLEKLKAKYPYIVLDRTVDGGVEKGIQDE